MHRKTIGNSSDCTLLLVFGESENPRGNLIMYEYLFMLFYWQDHNTSKIFIYPLELQTVQNTICQTFYWMYWCYFFSPCSLILFILAQWKCRIIGFDTSWKPKGDSDISSFHALLFSTGFVYVLLLSYSWSLLHTHG